VHGCTWLEGRWLCRGSCRMRGIAASLAEGAAPGWHCRCIMMHAGQHCRWWAARSGWQEPPHLPHVYTSSYPKHIINLLHVDGCLSLDMALLEGSQLQQVSVATQASVEKLQARLSDCCIGSCGGKTSMCGAMVARLEWMPLIHAAALRGPAAAAAAAAHRGCGD
jgi:hypothetical protein